MADLSEIYPEHEATAVDCPPNIYASGDYAFILWPRYNEVHTNYLSGQSRVLPAGDNKTSVHLH